MRDDKQNDNVECGAERQQEKVGENGAEYAETQDRLQEAADEAEEEDDHYRGGDHECDHFRTEHINDPGCMAVGIIITH